MEHEQTLRAQLAEVRSECDLHKEHLQQALKQVTLSSASTSSSASASATATAAQAKQTARLEFLEGHCQHLTAELQKKSKVIQHYMQREQAGTLGADLSSSPPAAAAEPKKRSSLASLLTGGSTGAAAAKASARDDDVSRTMQAVLEDTLLKNMQLQQSLDVLAQELNDLKRAASDAP